MVSILKITAKGQITLRRALLRHLGIGGGDRVRVETLPDGALLLRPEKEDRPLSRRAGFLRGKVKRPGRPRSIAEMQRAIEEQAAS